MACDVANGVRCASRGNRAAAEIYRIRASGGQPERITTNGGSAAQASPDGKWVYVTNGRGGTLTVIQTATDSIAALVRVGARPWGVGVTPAGRKVYTANGPSNDVSVIDADSRRMIRRVSAGRSPWGVAVGR